MKKRTVLNRRDFLRTGAAGTMGVAALSGTALAQTRNAPSKPGDGEIIYRTLGDTGIRLPVVSLGVMRSDNPNIPRMALDNGMVHLDTAHAYQKGKNEEMLGELLQNYDRDSFVIATKVKPRGVDRKTGLPGKETKARPFLEDFETSLKRLNMDYVDILYVHVVSSKELVNHEPLVEALLKLKAEGKTRFIGCSTHNNEPEVINAMVDAGHWDVVLTSYNFKQKHRNEMDAAIKRAAESGMGIVAMKNLAGGYLDEERTLPVNSDAAIKWALSNPNVHTCIPGVTAFDELEKNLALMRNIELTDREREHLAMASEQTGLYCTGCDRCTHSCIKQLPVRDMMRAYMYAFGYHQAAKAHELVTELQPGKDPCAGCDECTIPCSQQFDLKKRMTRIAQVTDLPEAFM